MTFDCLIFYDDLTLLSLRLTEHRKFCDAFIILENTHDFTGSPKATHEKEIKAMGADVHYFQYTWGHGLPFEIAKDWRNELKTCLTLLGAKDDDIVLCTDLDEIVSGKTWDRPICLTAFEMRLYYYFVNLYAGRWTNGFAAPYILVKDKDFTDLRYNYHRRKWDTAVMFNAGWHFSWLGGKEIIKDKFRNFGAAEGWPVGLSDDAYIQRLFDQRRVFHNNAELEIVSIDNTYPEDLRYNLQRYTKYLYEFKR